MADMTDDQVRQPRGFATGWQLTSFPHLEPSATLIPQHLKDTAAQASIQATALSRRQKFLQDQMAMVTQQQRVLACAAAAHNVLEAHPDAEVLIFTIRNSRITLLTQVLDGSGRLLPARRSGDWAEAVVRSLCDEPPTFLSGIPGVDMTDTSLRIDIRTAIAGVAHLVIEEEPHRPRHAAADLTAA